MTVTRSEPARSRQPAESSAVESSAPKRSDEDRKAELDELAEAAAKAAVDFALPALLAVVKGEAVPGLSIKGTVKLARDGGHNIDLRVEFGLRPGQSVNAASNGGSETGAGTIELPD